MDIVSTILWSKFLGGFVADMIPVSFGFVLYDESSPDRDSNLQNSPCN